MSRTAKKQNREKAALVKSKSKPHSQDENCANRQPARGAKIGNEIGKFVEQNDIKLNNIIVDKVFTCSSNRKKDRHK